MTSPATDMRRQVISTTVGLAVGGVAFFGTLLNWSTDLTRTAIAPGYFSRFFDLQGRALLDGQLHVPEGSLGIEGFIHEGRTYTYFPLWPSVLRLPVLMTTHEYDGRLTVLSMTIAWIVFAVMAAKLVWLLIPRVVGSTETTRTHAVLAGLFLAAATGGTFVTFDASLPWVYHEVYVWAVASAVGALYWMARFLFDRDRHSVWWLFVFALVAVGSRTPEGWGVCFVTVALGAWLGLRRVDGVRDPLWWRVLLAGAVPLAVSVLVNELKFGTVYSFPLQDQVWTQVNQQRQDALAANGGSLTGPQFLPTSFMAYLRPDGIRFVDYFPWITLPAQPAPAYFGVVPDQSYRTSSVTAAMPLFTLMQLVALVACFRPRAPRALSMMRWPLAAGVLITGGVMTYGYYANRYASDFVPALVFGAAVTTSLLAGWLTRHPRWRAPLVAVLAGGAAFSIAAQSATGLAAAAFNYRGEPLERYVRLQQGLSPAEMARRTFAVTGLPDGGRTDDLAIRGDCDALYVNTGDRYEPWLPVQERDRVLSFDYDIAELEPGSSTVLTVTSTRRDRVDVQVDDRKRMRFVAYEGRETTELDWFDPPTEGGVRLGIRNRIDFGFYEIEASPGGMVGYLPSVYFDETWDSLPSELEIVDHADATADLAELGLRMQSEPGFPLDLCQDLARGASLQLSSG